MRPPRLRLTVKRIMVAIATLAVSWSVCLGIGHLSIYPANVRGERAYREEALFWEKRQKPVPAAEYRLRAEEAARRNAESRASIITTLSLMGLVIVLGATASLGLAVKARYRRRNLVSPPWVDALVDACLTLGAIVLVGFALGCIAYVGILLFVVATSE
jgi:hypothetical protein